MEPKLIDLTDADLIFPAHVIGRVIPDWADIPEPYRHHNHPMARLASDWFFNGARDWKFEPKEGVDGQKALRMVAAALRSFEPAHEHKIAAVAYLLDCFFQLVGPEKEGS